MNRLKDLRKEKGLSQKEIASHLGVVQNAYSRYESGKRNIPIEMAKELARFYGVSLDYLIGDSEEKTEKQEIISIDDAIAKLIETLDENERQRVYDFVAGLMSVRDRNK